MTEKRMYAIAADKTQRREVKGCGVVVRMRGMMPWRLQRPVCMGQDLQRTLRHVPLPLVALHHQL